MFVFNHLLHRAIHRECQGEKNRTYKQLTSLVGKNYECNIETNKIYSSVCSYNSVQNETSMLQRDENIGQYKKKYQLEVFRTNYNYSSQSYF